MNVFDRIKTMAASDTSPELETAKKEGRKVIGYFCSYVPEELIHAAGFIPYRMRAVDSSGTARGDAYFSALNCTFVRRCFSKVLDGDFSFLDGVVVNNGCDHVRRVHDNWRYADVPPAFRYMFVTPHVVNDTGLERFRQELLKFRSALEENFGVAITDDALRESIVLYNRKRELLDEIYSTRRERILPVRGSELLNLALSVTMMPVESAITLLEEVRDALKGRVASSEKDIRIFLVSGCVEESAHLELIEECGGAIVSDNICLGQRHMNLQTADESDPVRALAARYLRHISCPRMMDDFRRRLDFMNTARKEYMVDAVIAEKLKFCDLWGGEIFLLRQEAKRKGFPILALERELYGGSEGQIRTRIQAFFERVRNGLKVDEDMFRSAGGNYRL